ncbi:MAG: hypothetical protein KGI53_04400, partial [Nitrospirota bacterium]|nr:hypothetical protein [Nitrospirota bacterium]
FEVSEVKAWSVHQIDVRLAAQDGLFTIGPDPTCPLEKGVRLRAVVKAAAKPQVLNLLAKFGVHPGTIFPGLEGAAKYVESQYFFFRGLPDLDALEAEMKKFPDDDNG